jgi:nucleolar complex protein 2
VAAFFRIRQLAITMPFPFIEECLKGLYLTYVRNARFTNEQSIPVLTFMGNCIVELFGLDMKSSFSHGFVYIRQLAMVLRNALIKKTKDSLSSVFNWQFLNSLRVWAAVVAQYPNKDELKDLVFPLVQVLMGVEKLAHSPRLIPFRLHTARLLNQLSASGCVFIPVSAILLDILVSPEIHKKPQPSTDLPSKFDSIIKLPEHLTAHQQDSVFNTTMELLHQTLDIYSYNPGFPEYSAAIKSSLTAFTKTTKIAKWRAGVKGEIEYINKQALWITQKRSALSSGPSNQQAGNGSLGFETLRPADKPPAARRLEAANRAKTNAEQLANRQEAEYQLKQKEKAEKLEAKRLKKKLKREEQLEARAGKKMKTEKGHYESKDKENEDDDVVEDGFDWDDDEDEE